MGSIPGQGTKIPHAAWQLSQLSPCATTTEPPTPTTIKRVQALHVETKVPCATTKTRCSQMNKNLKKNTLSNTIWHHLHVKPKTWHKWTYLWNRNQITDIKNSIVVAKGKGDGGGMDWEFGTSRCKLVHIEWVKKVLLYSIGNYIQYHMINHMEKSMKMNVYKTESLWTVAHQTPLSMKFPRQEYQSGLPFPPWKILKYLKIKLHASK